MQEVDAIDLPAGDTISLAPGGYHIMLIDIARPLEIGQKFNVTLDLEKAGEQVVEVEVREEAPTG
jgi:copper(I)-binding protein